MTCLITKILQAASLGILMSCSIASFAADGAPEIDTKVPATLNGKLSYASMKFWVEVPGKDAVELWYSDEDYTALMDLVGTQVALDGAIVTYTNGSIYFQPKFKKPSARFSVHKNGDLNFDVRLNDTLVVHHEDYEGIDLIHQFPIPDGQVALLELYTGGTACPVLFQLVVSKKDTPTMMSEAFGTCSDQGKLNASTNGFTLILPGNPSENWEWDTSSLTVRKKS